MSESCLIVGPGEGIIRKQVNREETQNIMCFYQTPLRPGLTDVIPIHHLFYSLVSLSHISHSYFANKDTGAQSILVTCAEQQN